MMITSKSGGFQLYLLGLALWLYQFWFWIGDLGLDLCWVFFQIRQGEIILPLAFDYFEQENLETLQMFEDDSAIYQLRRSVCQAAIASNLQKLSWRLSREFRLTRSTDWSLWNQYWLESFTCFQSRASCCGGLRELAEAGSSQTAGRVSSKGWIGNWMSFIRWALLIIPLIVWDLLPLIPVKICMGRWDISSSWQFSSLCFGNYRRAIRRKEPAVWRSKYRRLYRARSGIPISQKFISAFSRHGYRAASGVTSPSFGARNQLSEMSLSALVCQSDWPIWSVFENLTTVWAKYSLSSDYQ